MAEYHGKTAVLSEDDVNSIIKVNRVFDLYDELCKLIKSMSDREFAMLERSLEFELNEVKDNG